jgi:hypothetical protein
MKVKKLTDNNGTISNAMQDIKRYIDGNATAVQKVKKIEDIISSLYE